MMKKIGGAFIDSDIHAVVSSAIETDQPVLLVGETGVGKTGNYPIITSKHNLHI